MILNQTKNHKEPDWLIWIIKKNKILPRNVAIRLYHRRLVLLLLLTFKRAQLNRNNI